MNRRHFVILSMAALGLMPLAQPVLAQSRIDRIIAELRTQGYETITLGRTWLGRTRIIAEGPRGVREIVLNPSTGEILRDYTDDDDDDDDDSGRGRGRGRGGDDDDDRDDGDDDGDEDGDDDGGGGNSGSGGGGDGGDDD